MTDKPMGCVNCGADDHDTKDCTRLPVVAHVKHDSPITGHTEFMKHEAWMDDGLSEWWMALCYADDAEAYAQARLDKKNARIAQLAAHARGKNKALANALKEIERLKRTIETGLDNELALVGERTELRAQLEQLEQLHAAPAERGVVPQAISDALLNFRALLNTPLGRRKFCDEFSNDCRISLRDALEALSSLNPAPATAKQPWIPVSERLPDIAQEVIVHAQFDGVCAGVLDSYGEWFAPSSDYKLTRVNSWMPLPAAPATADSDVREVKE